VGLWGLIAINNEQGVGDGRLRACCTRAHRLAATRTSLNIRSSPGVTFAILGRLPYRQSPRSSGATAPPPGTNSIRRAHRLGQRFHVDLQPGTNVNAIR
jgi:hypothetical protein